MDPVDPEVRRRAQRHLLVLYVSMGLMIVLPVALFLIFHFR